MIKVLGFNKTLNEGVSQQNGKPYRFNTLHLYIKHDQDLPDSFEGMKASYMQIDLDSCKIDGELVPGAEIVFTYTLGREAKVSSIIVL